MNRGRETNVVLFVTIVAFLVVLLLLFLMRLPEGSGRTHYSEMTLVVMAYAAGVAGILASRSLVRQLESNFGRVRALARRGYVVTQFAFSTTLVITVSTIAKDGQTSVFFAVSWALSAVFLTLGALQAKRRSHVWILLLETSLLMCAFMVPAIIHSTTYHGRGDLLFHVGVVQDLIASGSIPTSSYKSWPVWHIGVGSTALVGRISPDSGLFFYAGIALALAIPMIGRVVSRLTRRVEVGCAAGVALLTSPAYLTWSVYLTPTAICFGFFSLYAWLILRKANPRYKALSVVLAISLIFAHNLSVLIIATILLIGYFLTTHIKRDSFHLGSFTIGVRYPVILGCASLAYWLSLQSPFLDEYVLGSVSAFDRMHGAAFSPGTFREPYAQAVLLSFSSVTLVYFMTAFFLMAIRTQKSILGLDKRTAIFFSVGSFLAFGIPISGLVPIYLFEFIQLNRWVLYGWFFMSIGVALVLRSHMILSNKRKMATTIVVGLVFFSTLPTVSTISYDTLPFREAKHGQPPRPFFLASEEIIGEFAGTYCEGRLSSDLVFSYFYFEHAPRTELVLDASVEGLHAAEAYRVVRLEELSDRGLQYSQGLTSRYFSARDLEAIGILSTTNTLADSGTSVLIGAMP